jgi:hypothetical protein
MSVQNEPGTVDAALSALRGALLAANRLLDAGLSGRATAVLQRARVLPVPVIDRYELGVTLLRASNGRDGWDLWDLHPSRPDDRLDGIARWDGRACRTLVVLCEQGFGDAIQFLRWIPKVRDRVGRLVVGVQDELFGLLVDSPMLDRSDVVPKSAVAASCADDPEVRWERLMSLPRHCASAAIQPISAYLQVPLDRRPLPGVTAGVATVGLGWRSTPRPGMADRSIPRALIEAFAAQLDGVRLVSLHRPEDVRDSSPAGVLQPDIDDFQDTAAVASACDLVLSADTVTAHVAAAVGTPTLIFLRRYADWRWGTPAAPTRWYTAAELLFQDDGLSWEPAFGVAGQRIRELGLRR